MTADALTNKSRVFYERAKFKQAFSLILGAAGLMSLGFCSSFSGQSANYDIMVDMTDDNDTEEQYSALSTGFGFASFFSILAVVFFWAAAIYIAPFVCGSANEKMMLKTPQEPEAKSAV